MVISLCTDTAPRGFGTGGTTMISYVQTLLLEDLVLHGGRTRISYVQALLREDLVPERLAILPNIIIYYSY